MDCYFSELMQATASNLAHVQSECDPTIIYNCNLCTMYNNFCLDPHTEELSADPEINERLNLTTYKEDVSTASVKKAH